jgi:hypothetical protein
VSVQAEILKYKILQDILVVSLLCRFKPEIEYQILQGVIVASLLCGYKTIIVLLFENPTKTEVCCCVGASHKL